MLIKYINSLSGIISSFVLQFLQEGLLVPRGVELHDLQGVEGVDLVDVLLQLVPGLRLDLLDLLQPALLDEALLGSGVVGQGLRELVQHVVEDLGRAVLDEGLEGAEVRAHLKDALQCLFGLLL